MFLDDMVAFLSGCYKILFIDLTDDDIKDWTHKANIYFIKMKIIVKQYEYDETIIEHTTRIMHQIENLNATRDSKLIDRPKMAESISLIESLTAKMIADQRDFVRRRASL